MQEKDTGHSWQCWRRFNC